MAIRPLLAALACSAAAVAGVACGDGQEKPAAPPPAPLPARSGEMAGWSARPALSGARLPTLDDHFRSAGSLDGWGYLQGDYGRNRFRVRAGGTGLLEVRPAPGTWEDGHRGFFLFRNVRGDFDARARLHVTAAPSFGRSLAGLLVRAVPRAGGAENWLALRAGRPAGGRWALERQSTRGSRSRSGSQDLRRGWLQLRIVRRGRTFTLLSRSDTTGWRVNARLVRSDLPRTLQVGTDAFGGELVSRVDWVRFR
jgi:hypothetical protein